MVGYQKLSVEVLHAIPPLRLPRRFYSEEGDIPKFWRRYFFPSKLSFSEHNRKIRNIKAIEVEGTFLKVGGGLLV